MKMAKAPVKPVGEVQTPVKKKKRKTAAPASSRTDIQHYCVSCRYSYLKEVGGNGYHLKQNGSFLELQPVFVLRIMNHYFVFFCKDAHAHMHSLQHHQELEIALGR